MDDAELEDCDEANMAELLVGAGDDDEVNENRVASTVERVEEGVPVKESLEVDMV